VFVKRFPVQILVQSNETGYKKERNGVKDFGLKVVKHFEGKPVPFHSETSPRIHRSPNAMYPIRGPDTTALSQLSTPFHSKHF
jgi:hypothetical protein